MLDSTMDRRGFVAGTAAMGAAAIATAAGVARASEAEDEKAPASGTADSAQEKQGGTASAVQNKQVADAQPGTTGDLSYLGERPQVSEADCVDTIEADVIILGGGHAGIQCAKSAAEGGLSVSVIEMLQADDDGTYYLRGEDVGHFNSQWLVDQGFGPYDTEEVVMEFAKRSGFCVNLELIRSYVENSGPMFDEMVALVPDDSDILDYGQCNVQQCADGVYPHELGGYKTWAGTAQFRGGIFEDEIPMASASRLPEFEFLPRSMPRTWARSGTTATRASRSTRTRPVPRSRASLRPTPMATMCCSGLARQPSWHQETSAATALWSGTSARRSAPWPCSTA